MIQVTGGRRDAPVAELLGDDAAVHALGPELGGVGVPKPVGVDALLDPGLAAEPRFWRQAWSSDASGSADC